MPDPQMSNFEALHAFRRLSPDEKLESLFMGQRETLAEAKAQGMRLDTLNGTTKENKNTLAAHLDDHEEQQAGINFIRVWGARGTGLIVLLLAVIGGASAITQIVQAIR